MFRTQGLAEQAAKVTARHNSTRVAVVLNRRAEMPGRPFHFCAESAVPALFPEGEVVSVVEQK